MNKTTLTDESGNQIAPATVAEQVYFEDGQTFQQKYDSGALTGPAGADGATGEQGPAGADGAQGPAGATGPAGAPGKSAYQYAVDGGYTGTEGEFRELMSTGPWLPLSGGTVNGELGLIGDGLYFASGGRISAPGNTGGLKFETFAGVVDMGGNQLSEVGTPVEDADAATKGYVDNLVGTINTTLDTINGEVI